jgi:hypothetical protein
MTVRLGAIDREVVMTAYNVVRFKVKSGMEKKFVDTQRAEITNMKGFEGGGMIKTGDRTYCLIGRWKDQESIVAARPQMIAMLDRVRDTLEDMGGGLGVTDPVSGPTVIDFAAAKH